MPFLLFFTALCIGATFFIADVPAILGLALFIVANFAYQAALIYYDATLKTVSYPETRGRMSGIGTGDRLLRDGLRRAGDLPARHPRRGPVPPDRAPVPRLRHPDLPVRARAATEDAHRLTVADVVGSFGQLRRSIEHAKTVPGLGRFLVGRFFYSDAVNTVIVVMSVVTTKALGVSDATANVILLLLTLVAIVMSFVWGRWPTASGRSGRSSSCSDHGRWVCSSARSRSGSARPAWPPFLVAGAILGSGLGGVTVADRVLMVRLSPPERIGEFFGLYGLVGKGSQVVGQLLYALIILLFLDTLGTGAYQIAVVSLLVTMLIGLWLIWPVRDDWVGAGDAPAPRSRTSPNGSLPPTPRSSRAERSVRVAARVALPPRPGRADHLVEGGLRRPPAEDLGGALGRRDQHGRIARPARPDRIRDRAPDGALGRRDHLADREPPPTPRLQTRKSSVRGSPGVVASIARRCASARSATWM